MAAAVTIVRDIGNDNELFLQLIEKGESGEYPTPRYLGRAGFLEGASPYASRGSALANSLAEARDWVDWYAERGSRQIKIYNSFRPEWVEDTGRHAHSRGLRVSGHVPACTRAEAMVQAGYDGLQHINQVFLNFLADDDDTRTPWLRRRRARHERRRGPRRGRPHDRHIGHPPRGHGHQGH